MPGKLPFFLTLLLSVFSQYHLKAQCNDPEPPGADCFSAPLLCASDLPGYCSTTPDLFNPIGPPPFCAGADNNVQWISFIAGTTTMQLAIYYDNCQGTANGAGIQAQVFGSSSDDCDPNSFTPVSNCYESFGIAPGVGVINIGPLVPGDVYYLIVDGWNGDVCDWWVEVTAGEAGNPPVDILSTALDACPDDVDPGSPQAGCERVCAFSTVTYSVPDISVVEWEVEGATSFTANDNSVTVEWGAPGSGFISAVPNDTAGACGSEGFLCIDIIDIPTARFNTLPATTSDTLDICQGQPLFLENISVGAETYVWEFGDGNSSSLVDPEHIYSTPGLYQISLIARNACFCADTTQLWVRVEEALTPDIACTGTLCENSSATYSTDIDCGTFLWSVSDNGTITAGGGPSDNFVDVDWGEGPVGTVSLEVEDCNLGGEVCLAPTVEQIGLISDAAQIKGPAKVCQGERAVYSLFPYHGTEFTWATSAFGFILEGQGSNEIVVEWTDEFLPTEPQWVAVAFENCYLGCGGRDTIWVDMEQEFLVRGPIEVCENEQSSYRAFAQDSTPVVCNWTVFAPDGSEIATFSGMESIVVSWDDGAGRYRVEAEPVNKELYCNEQVRLFPEVNPAPSTPDTIWGPLLICPGRPYTYRAVPPQSGATFEWMIVNGPDTLIRLGDRVSVRWHSSPPRRLMVRRLDTEGLPCRSLYFEMDITPITLLELNGPTEVCEEEMVIYSATHYPGEEGNYVWTVDPPYSGCIFSQNGKSEVEVLWHGAGEGTIQVEFCGNIVQDTVTVHPRPEPVVDAPEALCPGEQATVATLESYSEYRWVNAQGLVFSTASAALVEPGFYQLEVVDENGCSGKTFFKIKEFAVPEISIDVPLYPALCPGGVGVNIFAENTNSGLTYEWYQDGAPTGAGGTSFPATQLGVYFVEATDQNGCVTSSNELLILDCEAIGGTCDNGVCTISGGNPGCIPNGSLSFEIQPTSDCRTRQYVNTSVNFVPGSLQWEFGDPQSGAMNTSTEENPQHTFAGGAGFYTIELSGLVEAVGGGFCQVKVVANDTVSLSADFGAQPGCAGQEVFFFDLSTFLPFESITQWDWDFGDPAAGPDNTSTLSAPSHVYAQPGTYTVSLTITGSSGCQTSFSKEVEVFSAPDVSFEALGPECENTAFAFEADLGPDVLSVEWNFGHPISGAANTSTRLDAFHVYNEEGAYTVSLTGQNIYGCVDTFSSDINVFQNNLDGEISVDPSATLCEGDTATLTASPGGAAWNWSSGQTTVSIPVSIEEVYLVTVTDENGCTYRPPAQVVEVIKAPEDEIRAVEYNDNGLPAAYFYNQLSICEGDDLYLEMVGYGNYSYEWSSGQVDTAISFTEDRGNQLSPGDYEFYVTITDNASGCTSVEGPMLITVNAAPPQAELDSDPEVPICEGTQTDIFLVQPDPGLNYLWNTGATGDSISASTEGPYFAIAVDSFGCRTPSDTVTILKGPDIRKIPDGCHTACSQDTLCLPNLQDVVAFQWYLNGAPLPPPEGISLAPILSQSGEYTVDMQSANGCTAVSEPFTLFLTPGFGDISGLIYDDVNDNGQVDPADTVMSGIQVILCLDELPVDSTWSDSSGIYLFAGVGEGNYEVKIDTSSLPVHYQTTIGLWAAEIEGCEDLSEGEGLIDFNCPPIFDTLTLQACQGSTVEFLGVLLAPGTDTVFALLTPDNCDSLLTVRVEPLSPSLTSLNFSACQGDSVLSNGVWIPAGGNEVFNYTNSSGCDSTVLVTVNTLLPDTIALSLQACEGETILYAGQELSLGDTAFFSFTNLAGCDSTEVVSVTATQADTSFLPFQVCAGEFVLFEGQEVMPGDTAGFLYTGSDGCDSLVLVSVVASAAIQPDLTALQPACEGQSDGSFELSTAPGAAGPLQFSLDGQNYQTDPVFSDLPAGDYVAYLQDANGCLDSLEVTLPEIAGLQLGSLSYPIGCDNSLVSLEPVVLTGAEGEVSFAWENGSTDPVLQVDAPGFYSVLVSNACEELELQVAVVNAADSLQEYFFVPNVFSPNEDGHNDEWVIAHPPFVQVLSFELRVYSRWGEELFVSRSLGDSWDGNRPEYMNPGVYVWQLWAEVIDCRGERRRVYRKGDVTIVR